MKNTPRLMILVLVTVLAGSSLLYLASLTTDRFGFYHDDGIYVVTAKSLATGQGYRIVSLPYEPAQTKYPPFYPFLLSLIWRVQPNFPDNLFPMILLSVLATVAFLALVWSYLVKKGYATGWQALLVVTLTAINWRTVILATGIYSEMFYAVLSAAGLWLAEEYEKERRGWATSIGLAVVMGLAFLTRTSGITLTIAAASYYLLSRQFKRASTISAVGVFFVLTWMAWCYLNRTTVDSITAAYYTSYFRDFNKYVGDLQTLLNTIGINALMLILISVPLTILGLDIVQAQNFALGSLTIIIPIFIFIAAGFRRHISAGFRLLHLYVIFYLGLHVLWPYTSYDRFLMPILPFLLLFLVTELEVLIALVRKNLTAAGQMTWKLSAAFVGSVLLVGASLALYSYSIGIHWSLASKEIYAHRVSEDGKVIRWINANADPSDVLVCYRDPLYYLYTGRKAIRSFWLKGSDQSSNHGPAEIIFRVINETNGRYLILTSSDFELEYQTDRLRIDLLRKRFQTLFEQYPKTFAPVFESTDGRSVIYSIKGAGPISGDSK